MVDEARRALRDVPRPSASGVRPGSLAKAEAEDRRGFYRRAIAEVLVHPKAAAERLTFRWHGSEAAIPVPSFAPAAGPVPSIETRQAVG